MSSARHPLLRALDPVADALGAELVGAKHVRAGDVPLEWDGEVVGGMLDDRGAFALRRSVERVADAMGVSRFTIYNYLNAAG